ncbi:MAG: sigma 54-interacting transcriptional regulator [Candidatus Krumholzibacteriota bacterium]|nr:sigma 54-interacting transcriptional regulator [Candidatus Krumholzibacteriota bacterium]
MERPIFLSRFQVEEPLEQTPLYSASRVRDLLSQRPGLLYIHAYGRRAALDPTAFAYRLSRLRAVLGSAVPECRLGEAEGAFYVMAEMPEGASPLGAGPPAAELADLAARVAGDLAACREAGLPIHRLEPSLLWRDARGAPLYLPPAWLHFPGLLGEEGESVAPEVRRSARIQPGADSYALGRLLDVLTRDREGWADWRAEVLPRLLDPDPRRRPDPAAVAAGLPGIATAAAPRGERAKPLAPQVAGLPAAARRRLEEALDAFQEGQNVLLRARGHRGALAAWQPLLAGCLAARGLTLMDDASAGWLEAEVDAGKAPQVLVLDDPAAPSQIASPLWQRLAEGASEMHLFLIREDDGDELSSPREARLRELLGELPRLWQGELRLSLPRRPAPERRLAAIPEPARPLVEILALQGEPVSPDFLARIFPLEESAFFACLEALERSGELRWRAGLDEAGGRWSLRAELADPAWRDWVRDGLGHRRRRDLHQLCLGLLREAPAGESGVHALLRLRYLLGAELWEQAAREGLALFDRARKRRQVLLAAELAGRLQALPVESELPVAGKQSLYLYLAELPLAHGHLEEAAEIYRRGLHSLTGNPRFLDELLDEPPRVPELPVGDLAAVLPAVSALVRALADLSETRGEFARGLLLMSRLLDTCAEHLSARERGLLHNDLAWLHYRMGQHDQAVERCEVALRLFDPARDIRELGQTYNTLGAAHWALNRWAEAETYYKRALALRERAGDENRVAASLNNLGNLYRLTERFPLAIDYFNRSMAIKKRLKNYAGYLISLYNVALISFEMNDLKTARTQCLECLALNERVGNVQIGAEVLGLLGEIAQVQGDLEESRERLEEAVRISREIQAHTELTAMLRRLIPVHLGRDDMAAARASIDEGLRMSWRVRSRFEEAQIRVYESEYRLREEDPAAAVASLEKAADILAALDKHEWLARVYCRMGLIQLDRGLELKARECLRQATDLIERRKVSAIIAEWDALQMRLQQRLGQFADHIKGEGKVRLAVLYQMLNLVGGGGEWADQLGQILELLTATFGYLRACICLNDTADASLLAGSPLLGEGDFPDEAWWLAVATDLRETPRYQVDAQDGRTRLLLPLAAGNRSPGMLGLERDVEVDAEEERDFLVAVARLLAQWILAAAAGAPRPTAAPAHAAAAKGDGQREARLIGRGRHMQRLRRLIEQVRDVDATVLITGESGTGKEEVARAIHGGSPRAAAAFLPVNCASIPENLLESILFGHERGAFTGASHRHIGVFEEAAGGTVFLDEIAEMGTDMQAKLLRVLQDGQFTRVGATQSLHCNVRILTATNRDLAGEVAAGRFREDLFYRVNVLRIHLAPLREKREDLPVLIEYFLQRTCEEQGIEAKRLAPEVMELFMRHPWPGNVRQLQNVISSCVILSRAPVIQREDLPEDFLAEEATLPSRHSLDELASLIVTSGSYSEEQPLEESLLAALARRLVEETGSKAQAARMLGISKPTLYRRLRFYDRMGATRGGRDA